MSGSVDMNNRPLLWLLVASNGVVTVQTGVVGASVSYIGAGDYAITLSPGADMNHSSLRCDIRGGAANANAQTNWVSNTSILVKTWVGDIATDSAFELELLAKRAA